MAAGASSRPPREPRPSTAAPPARAPPSSRPAASCSRRRGYATACRTSCRRDAAACWRTSGTTATPTCSCGTSPATSWSSARTSTAAGESRPRQSRRGQIQLVPLFEHLKATLDILLRVSRWTSCLISSRLPNLIIVGCIERISPSKTLPIATRGSSAGWWFVSLLRQFF